MTSVEESKTYLKGDAQTVGLSRHIHGSMVQFDVPNVAGIPATIDNYRYAHLFSFLHLPFLLLRISLVQTV